MQAAIDTLWPYVDGLFAGDGGPVDHAELRKAWTSTVEDVLGRATLTVPAPTAEPTGRTRPPSSSCWRRCSRCTAPTREPAGDRRARGGGRGRRPGAARGHHRRARHPPRGRDRRPRPRHRDDHADLHRLPGDGRDPRRHRCRPARRRTHRPRGASPSSPPPGPPTGSRRAGGTSSPPPVSRRPARPSRSRLSLAVRCTNCGSPDTEQLSRFGSTACKALWRCRACGEPFDAIKAY